jgi:hypothetical protein
MYLWNYHTLAHDLKDHKVTRRQKVWYLIILMSYIPTGLLGSNWIPGFYRLLYRIVNNILAHKTARVPPLKIFNDFNYGTDIAMIIILAVGILFCYYTHKRNKGRNFIEQFMCLSVPVAIRIGIYLLFLFLLVLLSSILYFNYKLQAIIGMRGFFNIFKKLNHLKELSEAMAVVSHQMHLVACFMSLLSVTWCLVIIHRELRFITRT